MILHGDKMLTREECINLVKSVKRFTKAKLFYKGDKGEKRSIFMPNQRNSLQKLLTLQKGTSLYGKIDSLTRKIGYSLNADTIKFSILKYKKGHFIYKHRHDRDGDIFLTFVIQLNDSSDYNGGDFVYWIDGKEYRMDREIGYGLIIGPEVEHEVEIVTGGERHSFILFLSYPEVKSLTKPSII